MSDTIPYNNYILLLYYLVHAHSRSLDSQWGRSSSRPGRPLHNNIIIVYRPAENPRRRHAKPRADFVKLVASLCRRPTPTPTPTTTAPPAAVHQFHRDRTQLGRARRRHSLTFAPKSISRSSTIQYRSRADLFRLLRPLLRATGGRPDRSPPPPGVRGLSLNPRPGVFSSSSSTLHFRKVDTGNTYRVHQCSPRGPRREVYEKKNKTVQVPVEISTSDL